MRKTLRRRFWLEIGLALVTGLLAVLTLVQKEWIEVLLGADPDSGNGALEWGVVFAFVMMTILFVTLASYEWRRTRIAMS